MGFAQLGRYAFVPLTEPQKAAWFLTSGRFLRTAASSFIDLLPYPNRTLAMWKVDSRARKTGASQLWIGVSEEVRGRVEPRKRVTFTRPFSVCWWNRSGRHAQTDEQNYSFETVSLS